MDIKKAGLDDIPNIKNIVDSSISEYAVDYYDSPQLEKLRDPGDEIFLDMVYNPNSIIQTIVNESNRTVAFSCVNVEYNLISALYVHPEYSGQGIGTKLLDEMESIANSEGCEGLFVFSSLNAVGFYQNKQYIKLETVCNDSEDVQIPMKLMKKEFGDYELELSEEVESNLIRFA